MANTLRFRRLEFGRKKFTKGPEVIRHACCHRWRVLLPSGTHGALTFALAQWQLPPQAHMREADMVEGLE